ncbi:MAG: DUF2071 domain-containing protein [Cyclobacteriaceae bacterium]|nr:DUF2071 domain-containing protein [Cyclobacteriaceae bacterium]MCH8516189.1 DUF2071 domain-containing protein [Cyclobacteriaceae bacterium]
MSFLTAEWRKLAFANYIIDPKVLNPYLPYGTALDLYEGKCFISLVGLLFEETRLLGFKIPFHVNFEELNLRFYVKRYEDNQWKKGVVFIKEIVPKAAITFVANTLYNEKYETLPMQYLEEQKENSKVITYKWFKSGIENSLSLTSQEKSEAIISGSENEFIAERYWGYANKGETSTTEYEVKHDPWKIYPVSEVAVKNDFALVYGRDFAFMNELKPHSALLAEGSAISIENKRFIKKEKN